MDVNYKYATVAALGGAIVGAGSMYAYLSRRYRQQLRYLRRALGGETPDDVADCHPKKKVDRTKRKPVRIYIDGCFDMMHYGHR